MLHNRRNYQPGTLLIGGTHPVDFFAGITPVDRSSFGTGAMVIKEQPPEPVRYGQAAPAGLAPVLKSYDSIIERVYEIRDALRAAKGK